MAYSRLIVDGHIHVYDCHRLEAFFTNALKHMDKADKLVSSMAPDPLPVEKVLLMTEGKTVDYFSRFKKEKEILKGNPGGKAYVFQETGEPGSLVLTEDGKRLCYLLKGRQVVAKENLEVLHLCTDKIIADGLPIEQVLEEIIAAGGIAVLTWGFGKWFFNRGKIIRSLVDKFASPNLFIGDNSGRPIFWLTPPQFKQAEKKGMKILNGSDPLPFADEVRKPGSYGFIMEGDFDKNRPCVSVRDLLLSRENVIVSYGSRDGLFSFIKRQAKMNLGSAR
ncbi:MAG: hypothetical protein GY765_14210 [bacterium]|nr:hypothetical protein [bacterium]